jgi:hypothetical protein
MHVGGGCTTKGSVDNVVRDMLSIGSRMVWAYSELAMDRATMFLGGTVYGYGVPAADALEPSTEPREDFALVAVNPVTAGNIGEELALVREISEALVTCGVRWRWSSPNEDRGQLRLNGTMIDAFGLDNNTVDFAEDLLRCKFLVGNSSAALIEAPILRTPFIDCGMRQQGRPLSRGYRGTSIIREIERIRAGEYEHPSSNPFQHPQRKACESIIRLAEEYVANE